MPNKPSVAWIVESGGMAGGVRVVFEYAQRLANLGYPTTILSLDKKSDWFTWNGKVNWVRFGSYPALIVAAKETKPDICVATWWKTAYVLKEIQDSHKCRGLYLVQDIETSYYFDPAMHEAVNGTYGLGLEPFTTSHWVERQLPLCTYTGIAIGRWRSPSDTSRKRNVLAVMRRQALKGFRQLAEVGRYLAIKSVPLITFGMDKGIYLNAFHEHIAAPDDRKIQKLYNVCGVFISTSLHEGVSMTPLEAMASGLPVVMFDADGNMEYAVDGVNCIVARDPGDMADKVIALLGDRGLAARLSRSGVETARNYGSWDAPVARLSALIDKA